MVNDTDGNYERAVGWLVGELNKAQDKSSFPCTQRGCPQLVRGITSSSFWETDMFPWIQEIENEIPMIRSELLALRGSDSFQVFIFLGPLNRETHFSLTSPTDPPQIHHQAYLRMVQILDHGM